MRAEAERQEHASVDIGLTAIDRDGDVGGGIMAGALAYRVFIWMLPLSLVLVGLLGVASDATGESPKETAESSGLAGLVSSSVAEAAQSNGRWYALVIGLPVLFLMTRSLLRALIAVHRLVWREPRLQAGKPTALATARLLVLLVLLVMLRPVTDALWPFESTAVVALVLDALLFGLVWLLIIVRLPRGAADVRDLLPGAVLFGVGALGIAVVARYVIEPYASSRESTYGALGVAAALLLGLYLFCRLVVATAVLNAVVWEHRRRTGEPATLSPDLERGDGAPGLPRRTADSELIGEGDRPG